MDGAKEANTSLSWVHYHLLSPRVNAENRFPCTQASPTSAFGHKKLKWNIQTLCEEKNHQWKLNAIGLKCLCPPPHLYMAILTSKAMVLGSEALGK